MSCIGRASNGGKLAEGKSPIKRSEQCRRRTAFLQKAEALSEGAGLIFPGPSGKQICDMPLSRLVKELGCDVDMHGFRTSFRM